MPTLDCFILIVVTLRQGIATPGVGGHSVTPLLARAVLLGGNAATLQPIAIRLIVLILVSFDAKIVNAMKSNFPEDVVRMKASGWIDFKADQAFAPAECDDWSLVDNVPKVCQCCQEKFTSLILCLDYETCNLKANYWLTGEPNTKGSLYIDLGCVVEVLCCKALDVVESNL